MKLNADIIYQNLKRELDVTFSGDDVKELVLSRPEFYIDSNDVFLDNHVYVCSADHLPEDPDIGENVVLVCLGTRTPPAYFYRNCAVITVSEHENIFRVFNMVQDVFNRYENWEEKLNIILRSSASLQSLLDESRDIFNNPLLLLGSDFNYLAYTDRDHLTGALGMDLDRSSFDPRLMSMFLSMHELATDIREPLLLRLMNRSTLSINIFDGDEFLGCITVFGDFRDILSSDIQLCQYFSEIIKQAFMQRPHLAGEHQSLRQIFRDLTNGQTVTPEQRQIISRNNHFSTMVIACIIPDKGIEPLPGGYVSSIIEQQVPGSVSFPCAEEVIAVIPHRKQREIKEEISDILIPVLDTVRMHAGVSQSFSDIYDSMYSLFQAKAASEGRPDEKISFFEDHITEKLLERATGDIPHRFFYTDGLKKLYEHDSTSPVSYIETLTSYLDNNMSISRTAKELMLHRSSLIDRLSRINAVMGNELSDPVKRLALQIILHAETMTGK